MSTPPSRGLPRLVALLAEGVDRNISVKPEDFRLHVALLAEGVDRNTHSSGLKHLGSKSPSSRRAWIEISASSRKISGCTSRPPRGGRG